MSAGRVVQEIEVGGEKFVIKTKLLGDLILKDARVRACTQTKQNIPRRLMSTTIPVPEMSRYGFWLNGTWTHVLMSRNLLFSFWSGVGWFGLDCFWVETVTNACSSQREGIQRGSLRSECLWIGEECRWHIIIHWIKGSLQPMIFELS